MNIICIASMAFIGIVLSAAAIAKHASIPTHQGAPKELIGVWEVVAARIDVHAGPYKIPFKPNDVQFMGVELVIEPNRVSYDVSEICEKPIWKIRQSVATREVTYVRTPRSDAPNGMKAPLKDMGFNELRLNTPLKTYELNCASNSDFAPRATRFFMAKDTGRLYASAGDIYPVFKRRLPGAQPNPSFSCVGELSVTQRTICGSIGLSMREHSLADVWVQSETCRLGPDCAEEKHTTQRKSAREKYLEWLRSADACGQGVVCIIEKIRELAANLSTNQVHDGNVDLR